MAQIKITESLRSASNVARLIEHIAQQTPAKTALEFEGAAMSYADLVGKASVLGWHMQQEYGIKAGDFVGISLKAGFESIIAMCAAHAIGAAFIPIDPDLPAARKAYAIREAGISLMLTDPRFRFEFSKAELQDVHEQLQMLFVEEVLTSLPKEARHTPPAALSPEDPAYVIYTSGSTGEPKGVVIPHRGLVNLCFALEEAFFLDSDTRFLQFASTSFDASILEIFPTLAVGATVVLGRRETMMPGQPLANFMRDHRVTSFCLPPSVLGTINAFSDTLPDLRVPIVGGEACPLSMAQLWSGAGRRFVNAYGPTEATVVSTTYTFREGDTTVPIGTPIQNYEIHLLGEDGQPVAPGEQGEMCIGGIGVAKGYLYKPELTDIKFIPNPSGKGKLYRSGDYARLDSATSFYHFVGRMDNQIKIRGFRVELEAIESALNEIPGVTAAAVRAVEVGAEGRVSKTKLLVGYVTLQDGSEVTPEKLRWHAADRLPEYMVPHVFQVLDEMPMTANRSKIDRSALPVPQSVLQPAGGLDDDTAKIAQIFDGIFGFTPGTCSGGSDFFQLGGDSLMIATLLFEIEDKIGVALPSRAVYEHTTPYAIRQVIERLATVGDDSEARRQTVDFATDTNLPEDFRLANPGRVATPRVVLMTGATGFLGSHLLVEMLESGEYERIICLVRADSNEKAKQRLVETFEQYRLPTEGLDAVEALIGDLQFETLGLSATEYARLAAEVDTIFHSAADISYIRPYSGAKKHNVDGTRNVMRLAFTGATKQFHYVSTLGLFGAILPFMGVQHVPEDYDIRLVENLLRLENGYAQAKWVAERLVWEAIDRGLECYIYRPGFIQGHSSTGIANVNDLFCRIIMGCIQMGSYPSYPEKFWLPIPVDVAAKSIMAIARHGEPSKAYHLTPAREDEPSHVELFEMVAQLGYEMQPVSPRQWHQMLGTLPPENELFPLVGYLREKVHEGRYPILDVHQKTHTVGVDNLREVCNRSGVPMPVIDIQLLRTYINYFHSLGLIPAPKAVTELV